MKRARSKRQPPKASEPEHRIINGLRRVFGYYPTKEGEKFAYMEVEEATYQRYRHRAAKSGLSVGEEIALAMERRKLSAESTGRRCDLAGKEVA